MLREIASKYGLIAVLAAMPVYYGISDLANGDSLARLGTNLFDEPFFQPDEFGRGLDLVGSRVR